MRRMIVLALLTLGVWFGLPVGVPAYAANDCDTLVVDRTSDKVLGDPLEIESAALRLENLGIDVRVRAFEKEPSGSFQTYQKQQVESCASWQGPGGYTKGNLVTLLFSMDRKSYIFYGSNLEAELNDEVDRIRADYMNAEFKNGNFPGAITGTMAEIARVVEAHNNPQPAGPTTVNNEASSGGNALGWVLAAIASLAAVVALGFGGVWLLRARRRRQEELAEAKLSAETAEQDASYAMVALDGFSDSKRGADIIMPSLNEEDQSLLVGLIKEFEALSNEAVTAASNIVDNPSVYSLSKPRKLAEYNRITEAQAEVTRLASEAKATMHRLDDEIESKDREIKEAPKAHDAATSRLASLRAKRDELVAEGYRFNGLDDHFTTTEDQLARAKTELDAKRNGQALDELRACNELLEWADHTLALAPQLRQELTATCGEIRETYKSLKDQTEEAQRVRRDLVNTYTGCDDKLMDDGEAQEILRQVDVLLQNATKYCGMEVQDWKGAQTALGDCSALLTQLSGANERIKARWTLVETLARTLPATLDELDVEIQKVKKKIKGRDGSQTSFERDINACAKTLTRLREFVSARADLLQVGKDAEELADTVKDINRNSKDEHEDSQPTYSSSPSSSGFGTGFGTGYATGSILGSGGGGGIDFGGSSGGSSGGSWGGGDGGSSGGSW